jgi:WD40 repeat protein
MLKLAGHRRPIRAVAYSPGPTPLLASAGEGSKIRLWCPLTGEAKGALQDKWAVRSLAFSGDGSQLAVGGTLSASLSCWDLASRTRLEVACQTVGPTVCLEFSSDDRSLLAGIRTARVATWTFGGKLLRWEVPGGLEVHDTGWVGEIESAAFAPARNLFAVGKPDHTVQFWGLGGRHGGPLAEMPQRVRALQFSPGRADLLAVATGKEVWLWDLPQRGWWPSRLGHQGGVLALAFSPDGRRLLSGGGDHTVRLWEVASGRELAAWDWKIGQVHAVAFAPDGMTAAAGGDRPTLTVWDIDEG